MKKDQERRRSRPGWVAPLLAVAAMGGAVLALPGVAFASSVDCRGSVTQGDGPKAFGYQFGCNDSHGSDPTKPATIRGFSIISTKAVGTFDPEILVQDATGAGLNDESFGCEGSIPGLGFGCGGTMTTALTPAEAHQAVGEFELAKKPCNANGRKTKFRVWVTVAADDYNPVKDTTAVTSSEPFRLKTPKCTSSDGDGKRSRRA